jgi:hypothetical protein
MVVVVVRKAAVGPESQASITLTIGSPSLCTGIRRVNAGERHSVSCALDEAGEVEAYVAVGPLEGNPDQP